VFSLRNEPSSAINKGLTSFVLKTLPLLAFAFPLVVLYLVNPFDNSLNVSAQTSFELMWKGRTFQLFFIWLIALELILGWDKIFSKVDIKKKSRIVVYAVSLILPSLYLFLEFTGLSGVIAGWSSQSSIAFAESMPLAIEYLVFSFFFCLIIFVGFDRKCLVSFVLPALFIALVGLLYIIDNFFPYGAFTPFQLLVPTTAFLAADVLNLLGYTTIIGMETLSGMPTIAVSGSLGTAMFAIAWPCAGIESLLIFTAVSLLFLKRMHISWKAKIVFFMIGVVITYLINVLRIVQIFIIGVQYGVYSQQVNTFHYYYGPLYAMAWIVSYPLIIIAFTLIWGRIRKPQSVPLNPA
jgi:thaumarchaeosortase